MDFKQTFLTVSADRMDLTTTEKKTEAILALIRKIEQIENDNENTALPMYWGSIGSGLASAAVVLGSAALNPIAALLVSTLSVGSSVVAIGSAIFRHQIEAPRVETLTRYRLALTSKPANVWASLWAIAGTENFLIALERASSGAIADGQLVRGKSSINEAIDTCAQLIGVTSQEFTDRLKSGIPYEIKQTVANLTDINDVLADSKNVNTDLKTAYSVPVADSVNLIAAQMTVNGGQVDTDKFIKNAIAIRDELVSRADESVLGGCVILAAPGAGKTTFLGTAWGRLKDKYGDKFKSLAIVVKSSDKKAFNGVSDNALCIDDGAVTCVIAILRFIDKYVNNTGMVSRLFLDDFLTMNKDLRSGLAGKYIDTTNYATYYSRKEATELGADVVLIYDYLMARLNRLWLVGREYNAALWVSSHSSNIDNLPFIGGTTARSVGKLIFLAKNGNREFIEFALSNTFLISDGKRRESLKAELNGIDLSTDEPIILGNHNNWTLGIVSQEIRDEYVSYRQKWESSLTSFANSKINVEGTMAFSTSDDIEGQVNGQVSSIDEIETVEEISDEQNMEVDLAVVSAACKLLRKKYKELNWCNLSHDKLRKTKMFKNSDEVGRYLKSKEIQHIIEMLLVMEFVIETRPGEYEIVEG